MLWVPCEVVASSGTLTWANGDAATKNIRITVYNDTLAESSESFQLRLSVAAGASLGSPAIASVTISDDDTISSAGSIAFASSGLSVLENTGTASISVSRSAGTIGAVSVDYTITGGTATAGSDYSSVSGTLSWAAGDAASKSFQQPEQQSSQRRSWQISNATEHRRDERTNARLHAHERLDARCLQRIKNARDRRQVTDARVKKMNTEIKRMKKREDEARAALSNKDMSATKLAARMRELFGH